VFDPTGCCPDCGVSRQDAEFYGNGSREKRCKPCYRQHQREGYAPKRKALDALKLAQGCADCGYRAHAVALDFDHRPGTVKHFNVADVKNYTLPELLHEVAKCDIVCANCHRVRTAQRGGGQPGRASAGLD
jgi:hypothetical protein